MEEKSDSNYWVLGNQGCALNSTASEDSTTVKSIKEESNVSPQANKEAKEEGKDSSDEGLSIKNSFSKQIHQRMKFFTQRNQRAAPEC